MSPHDDELAQSWLARVALRYGMAPTSLLRVLDPGCKQFGVGDFARLIADLAEVTRTRIPRECEMVKSEIGRWSDKYERRGAVGSGSSFCPSCLADPEPYWRQSWAHPLAVVCLRHGCLLVERCPGCGKRAHSALFGAQRPTPPWMCPSRRDDDERAHRVRRAWCGTDLRRVATARAGHDELAAVAHLHGAIDLAARRGFERFEIPARGWQTSRVEYLDALFELVDEQVPARTWPRVGRHALLGAIRVAAAVVHAATPAEVAGLCERHGVMNPVGNHTPLYSSRHRHPRSRLLLALRLQSLGPSLALASRLAFRLASPFPRAPLDDEERVRGRMRPTGRWPAYGWVPPVMWPGVLDGLGLSSRPHTRAALSLAVSKVGSNTPLRAIAICLGLPGWVADRVARAFARTDLQAVCRSLEDLFVRLEAHPPPIDYAGRVMTGRDRAPFDAAVELASQEQGLELEATARDGAAVELWSAFTGSLPEYCPWEPPVAAAGLPWFVDRADLLARAFVSLPHRPGEPLVWTPP